MKNKKRMDVMVEIKCRPTDFQLEMINKYRLANEIVWNLFLDYYNEHKIEMSMEDIIDKFTRTTVSCKDSENAKELYKTIRILSPNMLSFVIGRAAREIKSKGFVKVDRYDKENPLTWIHFNGSGIEKMDNYHVFIPGLMELQTINKGDTYKSFWEVVNNLYNESDDSGAYQILKANLFIFKTGACKLSLYCILK